MMPQEENVTPPDEHRQDSAVADDEVAPNYRGMKMLVIGLGIAIVGMLALIVYTISQRAAAGLLGEGAETQAEMQVESGAQAIPSGQHTLNRPDGAELVSVNAAGAELVFHFRSDAGDMVIVLDRRTGKQTTVTVPNR